MPEPNDGVIDMPINVDGQNQGESDSMPAINADEFPKLTESGNLQNAMSILVQGGTAAANRRVDGADQLSRDMQSMWGNAFANPTNLMAKALQGMYESGSGRTRAETNGPANTAAPNITIEKQT